jgi:hypothetical protein
MFNETDKISVKWLWYILSYPAFGWWTKKTSDCIFVVTADIHPGGLS